MEQPVASDQEPETSNQPPAVSNQQPAEAPEKEIPAEAKPETETAEVKPEQKKKKLSKAKKEVPAKGAEQTAGSAGEVKVEAQKEPNQKEKKTAKSEKKVSKFNHLKIFNRWSVTDIIVSDQGLSQYITLEPRLVPLSFGRHQGKQFYKSRKNIVERLLSRLSATGHRGKKHYWTSNVQTGKLTTQYNIVKSAFEKIEAKTKQNPIQVLVKAIETGSAREGIATIEYGGVRYPKAAELSPQRRVDLVLRWMTFGAFAASRKNKKSMSEALANEILGTVSGDATKSFCLQKRQELERQAGASR